jgi:VWFA-related protein
MAWAQQPTTPPASDETPVFRTGVAYVRVDAQVLDRQRPLTGLGRNDFVVLDAGQPQPLEYFGRDSEPLWVLLLLDVSGSMKKRLEEMSAVARKALRVLAPDDHVAVMFFGRNTKVAQEFTRETEPAAGAIGQATREKGVGAGTNINPSVINAAKYIREKAANLPGRRAIIILTDNEGLNYQVSDETTLAELFGADAVLNAIVTPGAKSPEAAKGYANPDFTPSDVFRLARESGGEVMKAEKAGETFQQMLERIRVRYSLHYRAPGGTPGELRKIRVDLSPAARGRHGKAEVRARTGYVVPNL